ncbi:MAG: dUTP diphosphatase [Acidimicrobiales bacterium]|nr:dUTP diphosphatase [Acidimicrobiales bacterium]
MELLIQMLDPDLRTPSYAHLGDAGLDLQSTIELVLEPRGGRGVIPTGISIALPAATAGLIVPRSGLAARHGITCVNAPGLIDEGYRGEIQVVLSNSDPILPYTIRRGDRIAQLVIVRVESPNIRLVDKGKKLPETTRSDGGFGSTGR